MPIYTEILSDSQIVNLLPEYCHNIFVVGCGACTNESLAYKNDIPIYKKCTDILIPYATSNELNRIETLLRGNGFSVEISFFNNINGFLCMNHVGERKYPLEWKEIPDIILCMCCDSGYTVIKNLFPTIPVRMISQIKGVISYTYRDIENSRIIVKEQSTVILLEERD